MFFCSEHSRDIQEDIIGSASYNQAYVLIECPQPWAYNAFDSKWVPESLKVLIREIKSARLPIKLLLICHNKSHKTEKKTLLIYQRSDEFSSKYQKYEFELDSLEKAAFVIRKWLWLGVTDSAIKSNITRDILVCTHGSHDKCCSRYGNPFYYGAASLISDLKLDDIRVWKSSHFGGHRFAPTAIDLSDGRYYGALDLDSFREILTKTGSVEIFKQVYRGWSILPPPLQVLERELILSHGWDWFNYQVAGRISDQNNNGKEMVGEITFETPDGRHYVHQARIVQDDVKTVSIKSSCNATDNSVIIKYSLAKSCLETLKTPKYVPLGNSEALKTAS